METLYSKKLAPAGKKGPATLRFVDVSEIKEGIVKLNNGSLRAILAISSINFDLKSTDEQNAIILQYQNFLNSLDFPIELLIRSRRLNINPYLEKIRAHEIQQSSELLRAQTHEYRKFIKNLTEVTNIMTKNFYIVVPFFPVENLERGMMEGLFSMFNKAGEIRHKNELFEVQKSQLFQRIDHIIAGLRSTGLKIVALKTEETIELLYNAYNPNLYSEEIIKDIESLEIKTGRTY